MKRWTDKDYALLKKFLMGGKKTKQTKTNQNTKKNKEVKSDAKM